MNVVAALLTCRLIKTTASPGQWQVVQSELLPGVSGALTLAGRSSPAPQSRRLIWCAMSRAVLASGQRDTNDSNTHYQRQYQFRHDRQQCDVPAVILTGLPFIQILL